MHPIDILFWACLMLGGAYTLLNLLMGGLTHAAGHAGHIGHALHVPHLHDVAGHIGGHAEAVHTAGGAHTLPGHAHLPQGSHVHSHAHPDAHGQHGHTEMDEAGPRLNLLAYMNPMAVAGFLVGFGGAGVAMGLLSPGISVWLRLAFSGVCGYGLWLMCYLIITRMFGNAEGTSHNRREDIIGLRAQVTAPILGRQPGMISYTVAGARQSLRAVSEDMEQIPVGSVVRIRRLDANTAYVTVVESARMLNVNKGV